MQALIRVSEADSFYGLQVRQNVPGARNWERVMGGYKKPDRIHDLGELLGLVEIKD
jgi:hypothetical protein